MIPNQMNRNTSNPKCQLNALRAFRKHSQPRILTEFNKTEEILKTKLPLKGHNAKHQIGWKINTDFDGKENHKVHRRSTQHKVPVYYELPVYNGKKQQYLIDSFINDVDSSIVKEIENNLIDNSRIENDTDSLLVKEIEKNLIDNSWIENDTDSSLVKKSEKNLIDNNMIETNTDSSLVKEIERNNLIANEMIDNEDSLLVKESENNFVDNGRVKNNTESSLVKEFENNLIDNGRIESNMDSSLVKEIEDNLMDNVRVEDIENSSLVKEIEENLIDNGRIESNTDSLLIKEIKKNLIDNVRIEDNEGSPLAKRIEKFLIDYTRIENNVESEPWDKGITGSKNDYLMYLGLKMNVSGTDQSNLSCNKHEYNQKNLGKYNRIQPLRKVKHSSKDVRLLTYLKGRKNVKVDHVVNKTKKSSHVSIPLDSVDRCLTNGPDKRDLTNTFEAASVVSLSNQNETSETFESDAGFFKDKDIENLLKYKEIVKNVKLKVDDIISDASNLFEKRGLRHVEASGYFNEKNFDCKISDTSKGFNEKRLNCTETATVTDTFPGIGLKIGDTFSNESDYLDDKTSHSNGTYNISNLSDEKHLKNYSTCSNASHHLDKRSTNLNETSNICELFPDKSSKFNETFDKNNPVHENKFKHADMSNTCNLVNEEQLQIKSKENLNDFGPIPQNEIDQSCKSKICFHDAKENLSPGLQNSHNDDKRHDNIESNADDSSKKDSDSNHTLNDDSNTSELLIDDCRKNHKSEEDEFKIFNPNNLKLCDWKKNIRIKSHSKNLRTCNSFRPLSKEKQSRKIVRVITVLKGIRNIDSFERYGVFKNPEKCSPLDSSPLCLTESKGRKNPVGSLKIIDDDNGMKSDNVSISVMKGGGNDVIKMEAASERSYSDIQRDGVKVFESSVSLADNLWCNTRKDSTRISVSKKNILHPMHASVNAESHSKIIVYNSRKNMDNNSLINGHVCDEDDLAETDADDSLTLRQLSDKLKLSVDNTADSLPVKLLSDEVILPEIEEEDSLILSQPSDELKLAENKTSDSLTVSYTGDEIYLDENSKTLDLDNQKTFKPNFIEMQNKKSKNLRTCNKFKPLRKERKKVKVTTQLNARRNVVCLDFQKNGCPKMLQSLNASLSLISNEEVSCKTDIDFSEDYTSNKDGFKIYDENNFNSSNPKKNIKIKSHKHLRTCNKLQPFSKKLKRLCRTVRIITVLKGKKNIDDSDLETCAVFKKTEKSSELLSPLDSIPLCLTKHKGKKNSVVISENIDDNSGITGDIDGISIIASDSNDVDKKHINSDLNCSAISRDVLKKVVESSSSLAENLGCNPKKDSFRIPDRKILHPMDVSFDAGFHSERIGYNSLKNIEGYGDTIASNCCHISSNASNSSTMGDVCDEDNLAKADADDSLTLSQLSDKLKLSENRRSYSLPVRHRGDEVHLDENIETLDLDNLNKFKSNFKEFPSKRSNKNLRTCNKFKPFRNKQKTLKVITQLQGKRTVVCLDFRSNRCHKMSQNFNINANLSSLDNVEFSCKTVNDFNKVKASGLSDQIIDDLNKDKVGGLTHQIINDLNKDKVNGLTNQIIDDLNKDKGGALSCQIIDDLNKDKISGLTDQIIDDLNKDRVGGLTDQNIDDLNRDKVGGLTDHIIDDLNKDKVDGFIDQVVDDLDEDKAGGLTDQIINDLNKDKVSGLTDQIIDDLNRDKVGELADQIIDVSNKVEVGGITDRIIDDLNAVKVGGLNNVIIDDLNKDKVGALNDQNINDLNKDKVGGLTIQIIDDLNNDKVGELRDQIIDDLNKDKIGGLTDQIIDDLDKNEASVQNVDELSKISKDYFSPQGINDSFCSKEAGTISEIKVTKNIEYNEENSGYQLQFQNFISPKGDSITSSSQKVNIMQTVSLHKGDNPEIKISSTLSSYHLNSEQVKKSILDSIKLFGGYKSCQDLEERVKTYLLKEFPHLDTKDHFIAILHYTKSLLSKLDISFIDIREPIRPVSNAIVTSQIDNLKRTTKYDLSFNDNAKRCKKSSNVLESKHFFKSSKSALTEKTNLNMPLFLSNVGTEKAKHFPKGYFKLNSNKKMKSIKGYEMQSNDPVLNTELLQDKPHSVDNSEINNFICMSESSHLQNMGKQDMQASNIHGEVHGDTSNKEFMHSLDKDKSSKNHLMSSWDTLLRKSTPLVNIHTSSKNLVDKYSSDKILVKDICPNSEISVNKSDSSEHNLDIPSIDPKDKLIYENPSNIIEGGMRKKINSIESNMKQHDDSTGDEILIPSIPSDGGKIDKENLNLKIIWECINKSFTNKGRINNNLSAMINLAKQYCKVEQVEEDKSNTEIDSVNPSIKRKSLIFSNENESFDDETCQTKEKFFKYSTTDQSQKVCSVSNGLENVTKMLDSSARVISNQDDSSKFNPMKNLNSYNIIDKPSGKIAIKELSNQQVKKICTIGQHHDIPAIGCDLNGTSEKLANGQPNIPKMSKIYNQIVPINQFQTSELPEKVIDAQLSNQDKSKILTDNPHNVPIIGQCLQDNSFNVEKSQVYNIKKNYIFEKDPPQDVQEDPKDHGNELSKHGTPEKLICSQPSSPPRRELITKVPLHNILTDQVSEEKMYKNLPMENGKSAQNLIQQKSNKYPEYQPNDFPILQQHLENRSKSEAIIDTQVYSPQNEVPVMCKKDQSPSILKINHHSENMPLHKVINTLTSDPHNAKICKKDQPYFEIKGQHPEYTFFNKIPHVQPHIKTAEIKRCAKNQPLNVYKSLCSRVKNIASSIPQIMQSQDPKNKKYIHAISTVDLFPENKTPDEGLDNQPSTLTPTALLKKDPPYEFQAIVPSRGEISLNAVTQTIPSSQQVIVFTKDHLPYLPKKGQLDEESSDKITKAQSSLSQKEEHGMKDQQCNVLTSSQTLEKKLSDEVPNAEPSISQAANIFEKDQCPDVQAINQNPGDQSLDNAAHFKQSCLKPKEICNENKNSEIATRGQCLEVKLTEIDDNSVLNNRRTDNNFLKYQPYSLPKFAESLINKSSHEVTNVLCLSSQTTKVYKNDQPDEIPTKCQHPINNLLSQGRNIKTYGLQAAEICTTGLSPTVQTTGDCSQAKSFENIKASNHFSLKSGEICSKDQTLVNPALEKIPEDQSSTCQTLDEVRNIELSSSKSTEIYKKDLSYIIKPPCRNPPKILAKKVITAQTTSCPLKEICTEDQSLKKNPAMCKYPQKESSYKVKNAQASNHQATEPNINNQFCDISTVSHLEDKGSEKIINAPPCLQNSEMLSRDQTHDVEKIGQDLRVNSYNELSIPNILENVARSQSCNNRTNVQIQSSRFQAPNIVAIIQPSSPEAAKIYKNDQSNNQIKKISSKTYRDAKDELFKDKNEDNNNEQINVSESNLHELFYQKGSSFYKYRVDKNKPKITAVNSNEFNLRDDVDENCKTEVHKLINWSLISFSNGSGQNNVNNLSLSTINLTEHIPLEQKPVKEFSINAEVSLNNCSNLCNQVRKIPEITSNVFEDISKVRSDENISEKEKLNEITNQINLPESNLSAGCMGSNILCQPNMNPNQMESDASLKYIQDDKIIYDSLGEISLKNKECENSDLNNPLSVNESILDTTSCYKESTQHMDIKSDDNFSMYEEDLNFSQYEHGAYSHNKMKSISSKYKLPVSPSYSNDYNLFLKNSGYFNDDLTYVKKECDIYSSGEQGNNSSFPDKSESFYENIRQQLGLCSSTDIKVERDIEEDSQFILNTPTKRKADFGEESKAKLPRHANIESNDIISINSCVVRPGFVDLEEVIVDVVHSSSAAAIPKTENSPEISSPTIVKDHLNSRCVNRLYIKDLKSKFPWITFSFATFELECSLCKGEERWHRLLRQVDPMVNSWVNEHSISESHVFYSILDNEKVFTDVKMFLRYSSRFMGNLTMFFEKISNLLNKSCYKATESVVLRLIKHIGDFIEHDIVQLVGDGYYSCFVDRSKGIMLVRFLGDNFQIEDHLISSYLRHPGTCPAEHMIRIGLKLESMIYSNYEPLYVQIHNYSFDKHILPFSLPTPSVQELISSFKLLQTFDSYIGLVYSMKKIYRKFIHVFPFDCSFLEVTIFDDLDLFKLVKENYNEFKQVCLEIFKMHGCFEALGLHHNTFEFSKDFSDSFANIATSINMIRKLFLSNENIVTLYQNLQYRAKTQLKYAQITKNQTLLDSYEVVLDYLRYVDVERKYEKFHKRISMSLYNVNSLENISLRELRDVIPNLYVNFLFDGNLGDEFRTFALNLYKMSPNINTYTSQSMLNVFKEYCVFQRKYRKCFMIYKNLAVLPSISCPLKHSLLSISSLLTSLEKRLGPDLAHSLLNICL